MGAIYFILMLVGVLVVGFFAVYLYRLGLSDAKGEKLPPIVDVKKPKGTELTKERLEQIEKERQLRREGFNNITNHLLRHQKGE